ncbi:MAG: hypothetical protein HC852_07210 [Acaryochloridaceae cyanobacterium RU_4_10]|nr:hypothetical protein [Acaryochloridaceae cyanobacterium RU_4_10]
MESTTQSITFTPEQQAILNKLPKIVQQTLREYPSVAENFLDSRDLPDLAEECSVFEVYYDCEELPSIYIENGVIIPNDRPINTSPTVIEIMDLHSFVFIQVNKHVILNRLNGNMPTVTGIQVEV